MQALENNSGTVSLFALGAAAGSGVYTYINKNVADKKFGDIDRTFGIVLPKLDELSKACISMQAYITQLESKCAELENSIRKMKKTKSKRKKESHSSDDEDTDESLAVEEIRRKRRARG